MPAILGLLGLVFFLGTIALFTSEADIRNAARRASQDQPWPFGKSRAVQLSGAVPDPSVGRHQAAFADEG